MISAIVVVVAIFCFLSAVELISRKKKLSGEATRKVVHIVVGSFIAFWPFFMPMRSVQLLSLALFIVVALSKFTNFFQSIHTVTRFTLGELFFPIGIGLTALLADSKWIFLAAVLHTSLADGVAGLVGVYLDKNKGRYKIFGQSKTMAGSVAFMISSVLIIGCIIFYSSAGFGGLDWPVIIWLPILATLIESLSPFGTDNLFVPLIVVAVLNSLNLVF